MADLPYRTRSRRVREFCTAREPQSLTHFLAACGLPADRLATTLANAIRGAVCERISVGPDYVHAEDRLVEDLGDPFDWDSLDVAEFGMELEETVGRAIPASVWQRWFGQQAAKVKDLVTGLYSELNRSEPAP